MFFLKKIKMLYKNYGNKEIKKLFLKKLNGGDWQLNEDGSLVGIESFEGMKAYAYGVFDVKGDFAKVKTGKNTNNSWITWNNTELKQVNFKYGISFISIEQAKNNLEIAYSKLIKENGKLVEKVWKLGGMYNKEIKNIIYWLSKASEVAENEKQKEGFELLIKYYETGDLSIWDQYNVAWVETVKGDVDYINGFIEVYNDPKGYRGCWHDFSR